MKWTQRNKEKSGKRRSFPLSACSEIGKDYCTQKTIGGSYEEGEIRKRDKSFASLICNCWNKELSKWLEDTLKEPSQKVKKGGKGII